MLCEGILGYLKVFGAILKQCGVICMNFELCFAIWINMVNIEAILNDFGVLLEHYGDLWRMSHYLY